MSTDLQTPSLPLANAQYAMSVYANCDHVLLAWQPSAKIPECRGFAIERKRNGGAPEVLDTWLGFAAAPTAQPRPSTTQPVQKLLWSDFLVRQGDHISYRVVPVIGPDHTHLQANEALASGWTDPIAVGAAPGGGAVAAYFNRGILAAQWVTRLVEASDPGQTPSGSIRHAIATPGNQLRERLA